MNGNPFAPIAQGLRDIGQGYYRGQMAKMGMQQRQQELDRQRDLDEINLIFKSMQTLSAFDLDISSEEIVSQYAPKLKEITDGVVDWTNIDFKKTSFQDAMTFSNDIFDRIRSGEIDVETGGHELIDYRATLQKKKRKEYITSKIGLLPMLVESKKEEQKTRQNLIDIKITLQKDNFRQVDPKYIPEGLDREEGAIVKLPDGTTWWKAGEKKEPSWKEKEKIKAKYKEKRPSFDSLLGKLQSLRKKRSDYEARITQMGFEFELTPSVEKARKMIDTSIAKTETLLKRLYPSLWKDYQAEEWEIGKIYTNAEGKKAEYLGKGKWKPIK